MDYHTDGTIEQQERNPLHSDFHGIFAVESGARPLTYQGALDHGRWAEGALVGGQAAHSFPVTNGIPHIAGADRDPWGDDTRVRAHFERLGQTPAGLVTSQYEAAMSDPARFRPFAGELKDIAEAGGRILEVACGHGGGFSPYILKLNPEAALLMTDLGRWTLHEWREMARSHDWPRLSFAQADGGQLPFANDSFRAIISLGGYTNLMPDSPLFREAHRVLEPGGRFFTSMPEPTRRSSARSHRGREH
jgi:SAM-dependent methyltransferase